MDRKVDRVGRPETPESGCRKRKLISYSRHGAASSLFAGFNNDRWDCDEERKPRVNSTKTMAVARRGRKKKRKRKERGDSWKSSRPRFLLKSTTANAGQWNKYNYDTVSSALYRRAQTGTSEDRNTDWLKLQFCAQGEIQRDARETRFHKLIMQTLVGVRSRLSSREKFCTFGKSVSSFLRDPRNPFSSSRKYHWRGDTCWSIYLVWVFESGASDVEKFYTVDVIYNSDEIYFDKCIDTYRPLRMNLLTFHSIILIVWTIHSVARIGLLKIKSAFADTVPCLS